MTIPTETTSQRVKTKHCVNTSTLSYLINKPSDKQLQEDEFQASCQCFLLHIFFLKVTWERGCKFLTLSSPAYSTKGMIFSWAKSQTNVRGKCTRAYFNAASYTPVKGTYINKHPIKIQLLWDNKQNIYNRSRGWCNVFHHCIHSIGF